MRRVWCFILTLLASLFDSGLVWDLTGLFRFGLLLCLWFGFGLISLFWLVVWLLCFYDGFVV